MKQTYEYLRLWIRTPPCLGASLPSQDWPTLRTGPFLFGFCWGSQSRIGGGSFDRRLPLWGRAMGGFGWGLTSICVGDVRTSARRRAGCA